MIVILYVSMNLCMDVQYVLGVHCVSTMLVTHACWHRVLFDRLSLPVTDVARQLQQCDQVLGHITSQSNRTEREKKHPALFIPLYFKKST